ncbi:hypothetical protein AB0D86_37685 [Streptomyces sp. NPDC048324]|uniref:hypothetical protein n=1 Tax=Streptomyces sp. NPDC048324 TaxID=3157205 RepID=UPI0034219B81
MPVAPVGEPVRGAVLLQYGKPVVGAEAGAQQQASACPDASAMKAAIACRTVGTVEGGGAAFCPLGR